MRTHLGLRRRPQRDATAKPRDQCRPQLSAHPSFRRTPVVSEKQRLRELIEAFARWAPFSGHCVQLPDRWRIRFPPPTLEDWITRVRKGIVEFNTHTADECSFDAFALVCLHESAHVFLQGVFNKIDARQIRDLFGERWMIFLDIQADVLAADFLRLRNGVELGDLFALYFDTRDVFADATIRVPKFERFLGTILTITHAWERRRDRTPTDRHTIMVPATSSAFTEGQILMLEIAGPVTRLKRIAVNREDMRTLKQCYTRSRISRREYVSRLLSIARRFLSKASDIE